VISATLIVLRGEPIMVLRVWRLWRFSPRSRRLRRTPYVQLRVEEFEPRIALSVLLTFPHTVAAPQASNPARTGAVPAVLVQQTPTTLVFINLPVNATAPPVASIHAPDQPTADAQARVLTPPTALLIPPTAVYGRVESGGGDNSLQAASGLLSEGGAGTPLPAPIPVAPGHAQPGGGRLDPDREASQAAHSSETSVVYAVELPDTGMVVEQESFLPQHALTLTLLRSEETDPVREAAAALAGLLVALGGYRAVYPEKQGDPRRRWGLRR
jgi:hypothetical protein